MTRVLILGGAGALAVVLLVLNCDVLALCQALGAVGGSCLAAIIAINFVPAVLAGAAWRSLLADELGLSAFVWLRYTRNAATDLLAFIPALGEFVALREMGRYGIERHLAAGILIADLTIQLAAQLAFTMAGVSLLLIILPDGRLTRVSLVAVSLLAAMLAVFTSIQRWGVGRGLAALARRILPEALLGSSAMIAELSARLRETYTNRRRIAASTALHIAAWFVGIGEAALALRLMGVWPGLKVMLVVESLIFALRTTAFFIPGAWGVQEAAYVLVGPVFGLAPEVVLALALVKRARELIVGVPVLILGQIISAFRPLAPACRVPSPGA
jgi:putative membrane protein